MATTGSTSNPWLDKVVKKLTRLHSIYPPGSLVWHKAGGERLLVEGFKICGDGAILIGVTAGSTADFVYEFELSRAPVPDDDEAWREQPDIDDTKDDDGEPLR